MRNSRLNDIYNDSRDKVVVAMSIALGYIPSIDTSIPHNPQTTFKKVTASNIPLKQLYNTDPIAKMIIEQICKNSPELSLSKFDLTDGIEK